MTDIQTQTITRKSVTGDDGKTYWVTQLRLGQEGHGLDWSFVVMVERVKRSFANSRQELADLVFRQVFPITQPEDASSKFFEMAKRIPIHGSAMRVVSSKMNVSELKPKEQKKEKVHVKPAVEAEGRSTRKPRFTERSDI